MSKRGKPPRSPRVDDLAWIATQTGVSVDWLLGFRVPVRRGPRTPEGELGAQFRPALLRHPGPTFLPGAALTLIHSRVEAYEPDQLLEIAFNSVILAEARRFKRRALELLRSIELKLEEVADERPRPPFGEDALAAWLRGHCRSTADRRLRIKEAAGSELLRDGTEWPDVFQISPVFSVAPSFGAAPGAPGTRAAWREPVRGGEVSVAWTMDGFDLLVTPQGEQGVAPELRREPAGKGIVSLAQFAMEHPRLAHAKLRALAGLNL